MPRQAFLQSSPLPTGEARRAYQAHAVIPCQRGGPRSKRMSSRQELVADASQRIEVVAWIRASTLQLLAARIGRRPGRGSVLRPRLDHEPMRSTEVQDPELTLASDQNVSRLE